MPKSVISVDCHPEWLRCGWQSTSLLLGLLAIIWSAPYFTSLVILPRLSGLMSRKASLKSLGMTMVPPVSRTLS